MEIVFTDLYKKNFKDELHIADSHVKETVENSYKKHTLSYDGLLIHIYLSKKIKDKFYYLVVAEEKDSKLLIFNVFKVLKDFVDQPDTANPFLILQKLMWEFGFVVRVGDQLSKFIYKEDLTFPITTDQKEIIEIIGVNHSGAGGQYIKFIPNGDKLIVKCFLVYYIDLYRYKLWLSDQPAEEIAAALIEKLKNCKPGRDQWKLYEDICIEIIAFLFKNSFKAFNSKTQSSTLDGLERRDLLVTNDVKDQVSLWADLKREFDSNHIIFEFKNLNSLVGKDEIYQVDAYTNKAIGNFAIIFSRQGLSESGIDAIRRKYQNEPKVLILNCTDVDVIDMIKKRCKNEEPEEILKQKKSEFELSF